MFSFVNIVSPIVLLSIKPTKLIKSINKAIKATQQKQGQLSENKASKRAKKN